MWNWKDGSYTIKFDDDIGDPLTYYIDEFSELTLNIWVDKKSV